MAYNLSERFPKAKQSYRALDPGSYQYTNSLLVKPNKVPFLSKSPRKTLETAKIWTHTIYDGDVKPKIPNCTSFASKIPRFTFENDNDDDGVPLVCQCGMQNNVCECAKEGEEDKTDLQENIICQAAVSRRIFKGSTFHTVRGESLFDPYEKPKESCPPFYNVTIVESNAYYRGWKWSKWTSQRCNNSVLSNQVPGPADYFVDGNQPSYDHICAEKVRALKRKNSKQLRFIEKVQRQNILENLPGPANYSPVTLKGTNLKYVGSKAKRFVTPKYDEIPKPTTYFIKRDFDVSQSDYTPCHAKLQPRAAFGVKDLRLKYKQVMGPSPCSYDVNNHSCHVKHCNKAPFGTFSKRFTDNYEEEKQNCDDNGIEHDEESVPNVTKPLPTWQFKSKTVRMKPIVKIPTRKPVYLPVRDDSTDKRMLQFQYTCPFFSSEARFRNWFNWTPIHGCEKTPGPGYYSLERVKCLPAVNSGPINRSKRFTSHATDVPAPNTYEMEKGLENILTTYNRRLKNNIQNQHVYVWKAPVEKRKLTLEEQEMKLLTKSIALLDVRDVFEYGKCEIKQDVSPTQSKTNETKLLRYFLYAHKVKRYL